MKKKPKSKNDEMEKFIKEITKTVYAKTEYPQFIDQEKVLGIVQFILKSKRKAYLEILELLTGKKEKKDVKRIREIWGNVQKEYEKEEKRKLAERWREISTSTYFQRITTERERLLEILRNKKKAFYGIPKRIYGKEIPRTSGIQKLYSHWFNARKKMKIPKSSRPELILSEKLALENKPHGFTPFELKLIGKPYFKKPRYYTKRELQDIKEKHIVVIEKVMRFVQKPLNKYEKNKLELLLELTEQEILDERIKEAWSKKKPISYVKGHRKWHIKTEFTPQDEQKLMEGLNKIDIQITKVLSVLEKHGRITQEYRFKKSMETIDTMIDMLEKTRP